VEKEIKVIAVIGPTASGKSDLAVSLALEFNGEIVSADSRQAYRGLDIGSGKITPEEMKGIPHHLLDVASPAEIFTVSDYQKLARAAIEGIAGRSKVPFVAGGTGFYVDAALYDLRLPAVTPDQELRKELSLLSTEELLTRLKKLDPRRAETIDRHNPVRLIRALEIATILGAVPEPSDNRPRYRHLKIGIAVETERLQQKIAARLDARLENGLIEEVERLQAKGVSWERLEAFGLEYRYVSLLLQGELSRQESRDQLLQAIIRYSKRQMTWFKRDPGTVWIKDYSEASRAVKNFLDN